MRTQKAEGPGRVDTRAEPKTHCSAERVKDTTAPQLRVEARYTWLRLYSEFAWDPKVQMMSEEMQRRLIMLMCIRCSDVTVTLHATDRDTAIAFILRINDTELAETKALFLRKNFIDADWNLINWDRRQFASDSSAERTRRHRANKKDRAGDGGNDAKRHSDAPEQSRTDTKQRQTREEILSVGKSTQDDSRATPADPPTARVEPGERTGHIAKLLRANGIQHVNPSHTTILELAGIEVTDKEIIDTAKEAVERGKPSLAWVCSVILGRKRDADAAPSRPAFKPAPVAGSGSHRPYVPEKRERRDPSLGAPQQFKDLAASLGINPPVRAEAPRAEQTSTTSDSQFDLQPSA